MNIFLFCYSVKIDRNRIVKMLLFNHPTTKCCKMVPGCDGYRCYECIILNLSHIQHPGIHSSLDMLSNFIVPSTLELHFQKCLAFINESGMATDMTTPQPDALIQSFEAACKKCILPSP